MSDSSSGARLAPFTFKELGGVAHDLQAIVGSQLQECVQTESEVGLGFYHARAIVWLWIDLHPQRPMIVRLNAPMIDAGFAKKNKRMRPLTLFLRSRFLGRRLKAVRASLEQGRVLHFEFHRASDEEDTSELIEIEVRLFPHGQNVIARDGKKVVSELKPKDLPVAQNLEEPLTVRSWSEIEATWRGLRKSPDKARAKEGAPAPLTDREKEFRRAVDKKEKALVRMREELEKKRDPRWAQAGEWLKANGATDFPQARPLEFADFLDVKKSLSWNIENVFTKAKDLARKSAGTVERIASVEKELAQLIKKGQLPEPRTSTNAAGGRQDENLLARAEAKGRRFKVEDDLDVYIGKSAADNLAILRRAQPFDYWLHLRDQPGSHAILRRTRGRNVTDAEFAKAGRWVAEQSLNRTAIDLKGERHDLLIVECRFVRPIKGDRIGRVTYTNDRVLTLRF